MEKQYFYLRSLEFIARIFGGFVFVPSLITLLRLNGNSSLMDWHTAISLIFFSLLLLFIPNAIRKQAISGTNGNLLRNISRLKWMLLLLSALLLSVSIASYITQLDYNGPAYKQMPGDGFSKVLNYHFGHIGPQIIVPDIGFLVITFLAFYLSESLKISKKLKEEQSLTI